MELTELAVGDGHVESIRSSIEELVVEFTDWQEQTWQIAFENAIGVEAFGIEGEELDRIDERDDGAFMERSRRLAQEPDAPMKCYEFFSSWRDECLLTIIASSCAVRRVEPDT